MKKISIGALIAIVIGVLVALGVFVNNQNNPSNSQNQAEEQIENEKSRYTNVFSERERFEQTEKITQITTPQDIQPLKNETANTLFAENGFVVTKTDTINPFELYAQESAEEANAGVLTKSKHVTKDLVYLSYLSFFKKIAFDTLHGAVTEEITAFFREVLESETTDTQLKELAASALISKGEDVSNLAPEETLLSASTRSKEAIGEATPGTEVLWTFLASLEYTADNTSELQALTSYLNTNQKQKDRFLTAHDFWTYFYSQEQRTSLRDILDNKPLEEETFTLFSTNTAFSNIFAQTTKPATPSRNEPKPYDAIALAGNEAALNVLKEEGDIRVFQELKNVIEKGTEDALSQNDAFWTHSYLHSGLELLFAQNQNESEAHNDKNLYSLLATQTLLLQNEKKEAQEKPELTFSERLSLEKDLASYKNLEKLTQQIFSGLSDRKLLDEVSRAELDVARETIQQLAVGEISIDILNALYSLYSPEYGQEAIAQLGKSNTYTTLGPAHLFTLIDTEDQLILEGFNFSHHVLSSEEKANEWETKPNQEKAITYPLWTQSFIGIES